MKSALSPALSRPRVAIIGAGVSGLMSARTLQANGVRVQVLEKSSGVGGRMATRRAPGQRQFDHGSQYFTARDERFTPYVQAWLQNGIVAEWQGRIVTLNHGAIEPKQQATTRFVATPTMTSVCKQLASGLDVQLNVRVAQLQRNSDTWQLLEDDGALLGEYDYVVTSAPSEQSANLLAWAPLLQEQALKAEMRGCWAAMLAFDKALNVEFDGAFVHDSILSWVARDTSKPAREGRSQNGEDCWVLHASPDWSQQHIDADASEILPQLITAFGLATGMEVPTFSYSTAHRWRYAIPLQPLDERCLFDPELRIGACGDWCGGPRVEGAFLSGLAMGELLLDHVALRNR